MDKLDFSRKTRSDLQEKLANKIVVIVGDNEYVFKDRGLEVTEVVELTIEEFNRGVKMVNGQVEVDREFYEGKDFYISL